MRCAEVTLKISKNAKLGLTHYFTGVNEVLFRLPQMGLKNGQKMMFIPYNYWGKPLRLPPIKNI